MTVWEKVLTAMVFLLVALFYFLGIGDGRRQADMTKRVQELEKACELYVSHIKLLKDVNADLERKVKDGT